MSKGSIGTLAATATSALLVVPLQAQAVAAFEARADFFIAVYDDGGANSINFGSELGASTSNLTESLSGDAEILSPPDQFSEYQDNTSSAYFGVRIGVSGSAGGAGADGSAAQSLAGSGYMYLSCPADTELGDCSFYISMEYGSYQDSSVTLPAYESASSLASVNFGNDLNDNVLGSLCSEGSISDYSFYGCTLAPGEALYLTASANVGGTAQADYPEAVSEPASLALFGVGALGLAALRRRRQRLG